MTMFLVAQIFALLEEGEEAAGYGISYGRNGYLHLSLVSGAWVFKVSWG